MGRPFDPSGYWSRYIAALSPDECRTDHNAPCFYWHTKQRLLDGERLSDWEYTLIGVGVTPPTPGEGWRGVSSIVSYVLERDPRNADTTSELGMMQALMDIGPIPSPDGLAFLAG